MRKNEYDELMRIREIRLQPSDISNPLGNWNMDILWQFQNEKSGEWYGCKTERISMEEAIKREVVAPEQVGLVYTILAKVADTFHTTDAKKDKEAYAESYS
jgi:hypothetical protein